MVADFANSGRLFMQMIMIHNARHSEYKSRDVFHPGGHGMGLALSPHFRTCLPVFLLLIVFAHQSPAAPFVITVIDDHTNRGVPLVELATVNHLRFITDSAGVVAIDEPGFMNQRTFFTITSHGYEFPKDGFGMRGKALDIKPGGEATLKIKRLNIAQRLYRTTGEGIYNDTVLAGRNPPLEQPVLNAQVLGQDSVQRAIYRGQIHWFWGDTNRASYPLGHFGMAGAVSDLPDHGGLDPFVGVNLRYFTDDHGFSRPMVPGVNLRWADGFTVLKDPAGKERLLAKCELLKSLSQPLGRKLIVYNDDKDAFDDLAPLARDEPLCPQGHPFRHTEDGVEYLYFPAPYATLRVKADWQSVITPAAYEGFTPLVPGSRYKKDATQLDRDNAGKLIWTWKKNTPPISDSQQASLIASGAMKSEEAWYRLRDVETSAEVRLHAGTVAWNAYRKKWIMIAVQHFGKPSFLGEVWYTEADRPEGPYLLGRRIVTHDRYSFYNPAHHPFFDQDNGRLIYFEGTYTTTFSRKDEDNPTPRYDYNQVMYRLDLADPRLDLKPKIP